MTRREMIMFGDDGNDRHLGDIPERGAIFMSNRATKRECFRRELFGLPSSFASFVKHVKSGMILFLFEFERRELHGVFMASSDGAMDIVPDAFTLSRKRFPAQVRFNEIWRCSPLSESEFRGAIRDNYRSAKKFKFGLNEDQVQRLLSLFRLRKLEDQPPHEEFFHGRLERPIGHDIDRAELETLYPSPSNLVEDIACDVPLMSDEYTGVSFDRARQSSSDGRFTPQNVMEDDRFGVENDPVVCNINLNDISGRARGSGFISGEFMGASPDRFRQSSSDRKFIPQAMMEDDFGVENNPVGIVWNGSNDNISGRSRILTGDSIFLAGESMGFSPNVHEEPEPSKVSQLHLDRERSDVCQFLTRNGLENSHNAWNDVGSANSFKYPGLSRSGVNPPLNPDNSTSEPENRVWDLLKPALYHTVQPQVSDINHTTSQAASISMGSLCYDANAWGDVRPANFYHRPELHGSGVNSSVYPDKSTPEADDMVSDRLKHAHYHSAELPAFDINHATSQEAPISISSLPCDANVPRINYNNKATTDFNCSSDLALECAPIDVHAGFAPTNTLPRQEFYEYSRPLTGMRKLPHGYTNNGEEMISDRERWAHLSHVKFTSSAVMQSESRFAGRENGGQSFFSSKLDENIPLEYRVDSQRSFDNILSRDVENEALNGDNSMPIDRQGYLQNFDRAEVQKNAYNNKSNSTFHVDESNQNSKRIESLDRKKRSSVFSRLVLPSEVGVQESANQHFVHRNNMNTRAGEKMSILSRSRKQLVKATSPSIEQCTDEKLHINGKHKCKPMLKNGTLKTVPKKSMRNAAHVEEKNRGLEERKRDRDIEGKTSMESKQVSENLNINNLNAVVRIGDHSDPIVDFKRRRKLVKVEDTTENRDCERSDTLLSGQLKRRILIRPKFDTETSNDRDIDGETSNKLVPSSQERSVEKNTPGNNCEASRVLLSGQHGRRKLKRPIFGNSKTSNCRGINLDASNNLMLPSQEVPLENETSGSFRGFQGTQVSDKGDCTYGYANKTMNDGGPVNSISVIKSTVENTLTDKPKVPKDLPSRTGVVRVPKVDGFQDVPSSFAIKEDNQRLLEAQDIILLADKHAQRRSITGCHAVQDSTTEKLIDVPSSIAIKDENLKIMESQDNFLSADNCAQGRSITGCHAAQDSTPKQLIDVPSPIAIKDENQKLMESQYIVFRTDKHAQSCSITGCHAGQNSTPEKLLEYVANDTSHIESDKKECDNDVSVEHVDESNDVSVEHVDNCNDEICPHSGKTCNNLMAKSSCHQISESNKYNLRACVDGDDDELLQLSLETGSTNKRTSYQILKSLVPSEKQAPFDEDEDFLQLSLGRRHRSTSDAANCSNMQKLSTEAHDVIDGKREVRLAVLGGTICGMGSN